MIKDIEDIKNLLTQTALIDKKHKDIARITGADYNIFNVLRIHRKEVTLHSRMIKDLLNPKGKHAQGDIFLNLFLEMIKTKFKICDKNPLEENEILDYQAYNNSKTNKDLIDKFTKDSFIEVVDEKYAGIVDKRTETGGSIDIFLKMNIETHLVIENKIDAEDQSQQLIRYSNYAHNSIILYLTKYGSEPNSKSITSGKNATKQVSLKLNNDFFCISYKEDILNWLEECKNEVSHLPHLRETLSQYMNTVKRITNQNPNAMNKELAELIFKNPKYINYINDLNDALGSDDYYKLFDVKYKVKIKETIKNIIDKNSLTFNNDNENLQLENMSSYGQSKSGILLVKKNNENCKYLYPSMKFDTQKGFSGFRIAIRLKKKSDIVNPDNDIYAKFQQKVDTYNIFKKIKLNNYENWENPKTWENINAGSFEEVFNKKIESIIEEIIQLEQEYSN